MLKTTLTHVVRRNGARIPFDQERIVFAIYKAAASVGGRDMRRARRLSDRVVMLLEDRSSAKSPPEVESIQDLIEEVLITAGHVGTARSFIVYRESRRAARERKKGSSRAPHGPVPYRVLWETLTWNMHHGCHTLDGLNRIVREGRINDLVLAAEERFNAELDAVSDEIEDKSGEIRLVIVAGPSSSGKTTTTQRLTENLLARGVRTVSITVDNYFRDLEHQPRDGRGDHDYETPEAIDLPLFNAHLEKLITGKTVECPMFDFHAGRRTDQTESLRLGKRDVLLVDTLHGLYKGLTSRIPDEVKYKVYIEALTQVRDHAGEWIRWTDVRLLRRMARDRVHRSVSPRQTVEHWHYVRRSEKKHIIPYLGEADFVLNGSFPFELPLYRPILLPFFEDYVRTLSAEDTPLPTDARLRAERVADLLRHVEGMDDTGAIPADSVVREFIGGQK